MACSLHHFQLWTFRTAINTFAFRHGQTHCMEHEVFNFRHSEPVSGSRRRQVRGEVRRKQAEET